MYICIYTVRVLFPYSARTIHGIICTSARGTKRNLVKKRAGDRYLRLKSVCVYIYICESISKLNLVRLKNRKLPFISLGTGSDG